jgi:hypothetical protein
MASALSLACALALPLSGCRTMTVHAPKPTPTLYAKPTDATVRIEVFEVPQGTQCAKLQKARDVCVDNFNEVLGAGLIHTLGQFMKPGTKDKSDLVAEFRYVGFAQGNSPTRAGAYQLGLGWTFKLKRTSDGSTVVDIKETTIAPQELVNQAEPVVSSLINTVFERLGAQLTQAELVPKPPEPEPEPEPEPPPPACVAGQTQECVGPGACKGGQACLPDGSGFTECDCGSKKGKKSSGSAAPSPPPPPPSTESNEGFQP